MNRITFGLLLSVGLLLGCDPQGNNWGLDAIDSMVTPADPPLACGIALPADPAAAQRTSCTFDTGATPQQTLGIDAATAATLPIRHLIVVMKENRSFDHLLGMLNVRGQPGANTAPSTYTNPDLQGNQVPFTHATTTCLQFDPGHQYESMNAGINQGQMDGWVLNAAHTTTTDGHFVMSMYDQSDLPFDYFLATTYAINDAYFAPMATGTYGNRNFLLLGTNAGSVNTGIVYPRPNTPSIMQLLMNAGFTWGAYTDHEPFEETLNIGPGDPGVHTMQDFFDALANGTLPNVAFIDSEENVEDDHPTADLQHGEVWLKSVYDKVVASPQWDRLAMIWTYDEAGGFPDHVPPPQACPAGPDSLFTLRGPRIPLVAISPWAKRNYVSHVVSDHTAITRLIETLFGLPALTARDANSEALLDMFDFSCGANTAVPPAPQPGTGGCTP